MLLDTWVWRCCCRRGSQQQQVWPAYYSSSLPVALLWSAQPIPNSPKGPGRLLLGGCSGSNNYDSASGGGGGGAELRCCLSCDLPVQYDGPVRVEVRGRSSQAASKKSYALVSCRGRPATVMTGWQCASTYCMYITSRQAADAPTQPDRCMCACW